MTVAKTLQTGTIICYILACNSSIYLHCAATMMTVCASKADHGKIEGKTMVYAQVTL